MRELGSEYKVTNWCLEYNSREKSWKAKIKNIIRVLKRARRHNFFLSQIIVLLTGKMFSDEIAGYRESIQSSLDILFSEYADGDLYCDRCVQAEGLDKAMEGLEKDEFSDLVVVGAPYIQEKNLKKFRRCLNLHFGILPKYRGSYTIEWACINKDFLNIGYTIHAMSNMMDGGRILARESIERAEYLRIAEMYEFCFRRGIKAMVKLISCKDLYKSKDSDERLYPQYWAGRFSVFEFRRLKDRI